MTMTALPSCFYVTPVAKPDFQVYECSPKGYCNVVFAFDPDRVADCFGIPNAEAPFESCTGYGASECQASIAITYDYSHDLFGSDVEIDALTVCETSIASATDWCEEHGWKGENEGDMEVAVEEREALLNTQCSGVVVATILPAEGDCQQDDAASLEDPCDPDATTADARRAPMVGFIDPTLSWVSATLGDASYFSTLSGSAILDDQPDKAVVAAAASGQAQQAPSGAFTQLRVLLDGTAELVPGGSGSFTIPPSPDFSIVVQGLLDGDTMAIYVAPDGTASGVMNASGSTWELDYEDMGANATIEIHLEGAVEHVP